MKIKLMIMSAAVIGVLGLASCSKDETPDNTSGGSSGSTCRVNAASGVVFGDNVSISFTYDANKRLSSYTSNSGGDKEGEIYTYNSSGQLIKTEYWETTSSDITSYSEITWANGKVTEVKNYEDDGNGGFSLESTDVPTYTGERITKMESYVSGSVDSYEEYTYDSKGNPTKIVYYYSDGNGGFEPNYRENYTYDDKKGAEAFNRVSADNSLIIAVNNQLQNKSESYDSQTQTWSTDSDFTYSYTYNSNNYPATISLSGLGNISLSYTCD